MPEEKLNIRSTFLADEDCVMVRCALSQAEDRVCKMYCGTPNMVELANIHPLEYDVHTENAKRIFKKAVVSKEQRNLGKTCVHAAERKMQGNTMSGNITKATKGKLFIHPRKCDQMIRAFLDSMPEIEDIYFPWVEKQVRVRRLVNSWGRVFDLDYMRIDDNLYREAYSWYLQSECADWTNQYLLIPTFHYLWGRYGKAPNAQVHDEVIGCVPLEDAYDLSLVMVMAAEQSREIPAGSGNFLKLPAGIVVGRDWGDKRFEWDKLPSKGEFYEQLREGGF